MLHIHYELQFSNVPKEHIKNYQNGISKTAETAYQDVPKSHTNKTDINKTESNQKYNSQSVENIYSLEEILKNCELYTFAKDERKILYDAIERLFYTDGLKIGQATLPQRKVRSRMYELNPEILRTVLHKLHSNDRQIKNITGYVMIVIFNCITEEYSLLHVDPYLNYQRKSQEE